MGKNSNNVKSEFLGMPHGTANSKLRKMILFKLVQEAGKDMCFKCGKKIESVDEFSIEHKLPWLGRSVDLFWDLENIAFSHLACNKPHEYNYPTKRIDSPDGMSWCGRCRQFKPISEFHHCASMKNGVFCYCKKCRMDYTASLKENRD